MAILTFAGTRGYLCNGILSIFLLIYLGCATVPPQPVTIKHERTPSLRDAAKEKQQYQKKPIDQSVVELSMDKQLSKKPADQGVALSKDKQLGKEPVEQGVESSKEQQLSKEPVDQTITALLNLLKERNVISADEAERILEKSATQAAREKQIVQEQVKSEVQEELPKEIKKMEMATALPEWTKRIRFRGDIRLRYEGDFFDKNNADFFEPSDPTKLMNTKDDEYHFNYRVRFGAEAHVNEQLDAVIILATGRDTNPVSPNSSLEDSMNKNDVLFDLAYLKWQPLDFLTIWGGRIPNLWFSPSELVWDSDLNFDGLVLNVRKPITESLTPFLTVGVFPLQQSDPIDIFDSSQHRKWLYAGQLGVEWKGKERVAAKIGAAYYHFSNITGIHADPLHTGLGLTDWTAPLFQQKGNTLFDIHNFGDPNGSKLALASEFRELNLTGTLDIGFWDPYHVIFLGDYVKNFGFDQSKVNELVGDIDLDEEGFQAPLKETIGYQIGMSVGYPTIENLGQWKTYLYYKNVEADSVVDAFTDSDFHLGGTNTKGWILGAEVGLWKNVWLVLKWLTADEISGPPLAIDVFFVDFNARF